MRESKMREIEKREWNCFSNFKIFFLSIKIILKLTSVQNKIWEREVGKLMKETTN